MAHIKWTGLSGAALFLAFFFIPFAWIKLVLLAYFFIFCDFYVSKKIKIICAQLFLIFLFFADFIFTPFSHSLSIYIKQTYNEEFYILWVILGVIVTAMIAWIYTLIRLFHLEENKIELEEGLKPDLFSFIRRNYPGLFVLALITIIISPTLPLDFSYGGDEHYHANSIVICQRIFFFILESPESVLFISITILLAFLIYLNKKAKQNEYLRLTLITLFVAIPAAYLFFIYSNTELDELTIERSLRYPCSEAWVSAFLGFLDFSFWQEVRSNCLKTINESGIMRLFPSSSYLLISYLIYKHLTKSLDNIYAAAIMFAVSTIPIFLYKSTLLYLEFPLVLALFIVLLDSEKIIRAPINELSQNTSFYALLSLQFLKESGFVAAAVIVFLRFLFKLKEIRLSNNYKEIHTMLKNEFPVVYVSLISGILYLIARSLTPYRPYNFHPYNLLSTDLWAKGLEKLIQQYHLFLILIIPTIFNIIRGKNKFLFTCVAIGVAMWAFYFLEDPKWIGLARFNLLLAPAIVILSIPVFVKLYEKKKKTYFFALIASLITINFLNIPFDVKGFRRDWGGSGERWYDWSKCFTDIKRDNPNAVILVSNMPYKYGFGLVFAKLGWFPDLKEAKPIVPENELQDFEASLTVFKNSNSNFLIYRYENLPDGGNLNIEKIIEGKTISVFGKYPSAAGGLLVLKKQNNLQ